ncbi:VTT domain-containing protein [Herminiimonas sp. CN]|uniref:VTT domain-containing protein n=1 Tax=Herminiimonas sp. CN TaxID=1349818 RepID=UPI0004735496|nr:VTT domain-containing protein [Herminiimonas sp. CN]
MEDIVSLFAQYGLLAVFVCVLVEQLGAPVPALPFLLLAGGAAASDGVFAMQAVAVATLASMIADSLWFFAGRRFGHRVLALLCRISISPDSCVRQSELSFARRGVATLVVAKFVPGLSTLAPPLAGALGMRTVSFAVFNLAGSILWAGSGIAGGLFFHNQIESLLKNLSDLGSTAVAIVAGFLGAYIAGRIWRRWRVARLVANLPMVQPDELADLIAKGEDLVIVDVRASLNQLSLDERIPGARHIELASIETISIDGWPQKAKIITYCSCPNDASALKAAYLLTKRGLVVSVLNGGIEGWADAGHPMEAAGI